MARLNVALIGSGRHGGVLLEKYMGPLKDRVGRLYVADTNQARLQEIGERYPHIRLFHSSEELFENIVDIDMVNVATSSIDRYPVHEALERGKPVLVETPLADSLGKAVELTKIAIENDVLNAVGEQEVLEPAIINAREVVDGYEGRLEMEVEWLKNRGHRTHVITDTMIEDTHPYSLVAHLMGEREPDSVICSPKTMLIHINPEDYDTLGDETKRKVSHRGKADDGCLLAEVIGEHEAVIYYSDGSRAKVRFSYETPWKSRRIRVRAFDPVEQEDTQRLFSGLRGFEADITYLPEELREGYGSSLTVYKPKGKSDPERTGVMDSRKAEFPQEDFFLKQINLFMDSVENGMPTGLLSFGESLSGLALADAAREAARTGKVYSKDFLKKNGIEP